MRREALGTRPPLALETRAPDRVEAGGLALAPCGRECAACRLGLEGDAPCGPGARAFAEPSAEPVPQQERAP